MKQAKQERRQHPRQHANFHIKVKTHQERPMITVELRDISEGGMSFIAENLADYSEHQCLGVRIPAYDEQGVLFYQELNMEIVWLQAKDRLNPQAWVGLRLVNDGEFGLSSSNIPLFW
ncbi:MAG: PilZ domain-containing protein [Mariprofundaceae bacterium]|nr:PilZ domain-containing protein [Mariprofundaceae bacterium]